MVVFQAVAKNPRESARIVVEEISPKLKLNDKVFLIGDLGSGKTFMVKHFMKCYGTSKEASSPSFSLVNEYRFQGARVLHIDLYRLDNPLDLAELDLITELQAKQLVFMEWGDKFPFLLKWATKKITLKIVSEHSREIIFETN